MVGTEVSPALISTVTDAVMDDVKQWQSRPLDAVYPVLYMDCIHVKVRDTGTVRNKAINIAITVSPTIEKWSDAYPSIAKSWRNNWKRVIPFFAFLPEIRKIIYTTNAIESVNMSLRKVTQNRGSFPNDDAVIKLFYLALINISKKWTMPLRDWKPALNRFSIQFEDRMPQQ